MNGWRSNMLNVRNEQQTPKDCKKCERTQVAFKGAWNDCPPWPMIMGQWLALAMSVCKETPSMTETNARQDGPSIEPIVEPFAALLDELRLGPNEIHDEAELPYPKPQILEALLSGLKDLRAHRYSPAQLKGWLVELAQFQPDVGSPIRERASEMARRMTSATSRGERVDTEDLEREVATAAREERWDARRAQFRAAVEQERIRLLGLLSTRW
jgi:hypothetical protein